MARQTLKKVLIVEDDGLLAASLEDAFHAAGVKDVRLCATASAAMNQIAEIAPQVMVLDVNLADRNDGWALAELSRELFDKPPLIIFSTGMPEAIPDEVKDMGRVMGKPYAPDDLVAEAMRHAPRSMLSRLLGQR